MNTKYMPVGAMTGCVSRISLNLDDMDKYPDAKYWMDGALWARDQAIKACGDFDRATSIMDRLFWKKTNTWMTICLRAERMLALIKALQGEKDEK